MWPARSVCPQLLVPWRVRPRRRGAAKHWVLTLGEARTGSPCSDIDAALDSVLLWLLALSLCMWRAMYIPAPSIFSGSLFRAAVTQSSTLCAARGLDESRSVPSLCDWRSLSRSSWCAIDARKCGARRGQTRSARTRKQAINHYPHRHEERGQAPSLHHPDALTGSRCVRTSPRAPHPPYLRGTTPAR